MINFKLPLADSYYTPEREYKKLIRENSIHNYLLQNKKNLDQIHKKKIRILETRIIIKYKIKSRCF